MTAATAAQAPLAQVDPDLGHAGRVALRTGAIGGIVAIYLCLVGIVGAGEDRPLIVGVVTLAQAWLITTFLITALAAARRFGPAPPALLITCASGAGVVAGAFLSGLVLLGSAVDLREYLLNASPALWDILTAGMGTSGFWVPAAAGLVTGAVAGVLWSLPNLLRTAILSGLLLLLIMGLFSGLLRTPMLAGPLAGLGRFLFAFEGLQPIGAVLSFLIGAGGALVIMGGRVRQRVRTLSPTQRRNAGIPLSLLLLALVLLMPLGLGPFVAQVVAIIALYVLMGLGLNITLGLAGLLDLGFVAFFAVGAYTVGLLTSTGQYGIAEWSFWMAVPFAVLLAMLAGVVLGLPLLGMRGDYLAIATLGFGEIVRILLESNLLLEYLGGPRGITNIPKPIDVPPTSWLSGPTQIYYIALACAAVVAFVAWRLKSARLGRAWVAIREDEDVAEALGVNLVQTKILAYMLGAAFAGLAGAVYAALLGAIFPSNFDLQKSIDVVAIVVVGGMGSIPGVVLGAIVLIGLPELFREFTEFRYLFYGAALIVMMRYRPEGLIPSRIGKQELHHDASMDDPLSATAAVEPS
jgi:branched-chain amino acid transport system permease protein